MMFLNQIITSELGFSSERLQIYVTLKKMVLVLSKQQANFRNFGFGFVERFPVANLITFSDWLQQNAAVCELQMSHTFHIVQSKKHDKPPREHHVLPSSSVVKPSSSKLLTNARRAHCPLCDISHKILRFVFFQIRQTDVHCCS